MKKIITVLLVAFTTIIANAQNTWQFDELRWFNEDHQLVKKEAKLTFITINKSTIVIDTPGAVKRTLYRVNYYNDEFEVSNYSTYDNGLEFRNTEELCIDITPEEFQRLSKTARGCHIFDVTLTNIYNYRSQEFIGARIDILSTETNRAIRYTF